MAALYRSRERATALLQAGQRSATICQPRQRLSALFQPGQYKLVLARTAVAPVLGRDPFSIEQQRIQRSPVERPGTHWSGVDVEETGVRIPTNSAPPQTSREQHRLFATGFEPNVERAAVDVLAVVGHPEGRLRQHGVGLAGAV